MKCKCNRCGEVGYVAALSTQKKRDNMKFYCLLFVLVVLAVALIEINMAFYCLLFALVALAVALVGINMHFSVNSAVTCSL